MTDRPEFVLRRGSPAAAAVGEMGPVWHGELTLDGIAVGGLLSDGIEGWVSEVLCTNVRNLFAMKIVTAWIAPALPSICQTIQLLLQLLGTLAGVAIMASSGIHFGVWWMVPQRKRRRCAVSPANEMGKKVGCNMMQKPPECDRGRRMGKDPKDPRAF